jgi:serine/threonine protein kinase
MRRIDLPEIPGYEIKHELGVGGMATVFLAIQKSLDRKVAIKILRTEHDDDADKTERRFLREGRTLAKITHRNVCGIYDIAKIGDIAYIAMEYLDGGTLVEKLKSGLSVGEAIAVTVQVASALTEAHAQGIIHRDLKPANVMMRGGRVPVLTDFGIARELTANQTKITAENMIVGTPAYMSPEQVTGGEVDASSDVYSLGIMLFELLTGQVPYKGDSPIAVCMQHLTATLPKLPRQLTELQPIMDRMLAKKREERYASMPEFTSALRNAFVASDTLRSVLKFAPDQPWSEQLRNLGFTFDTIRDSDIKEAMAAQKAAVNAASRHYAPSESTRLPQALPPTPGRNWLVVVLLSILIVMLAGGTTIWLLTRGPSATDELALRSLSSDFTEHLAAGKLYGDDQDNAAAILAQMRAISGRSEQTREAERNLWLSTEQAANNAVDQGQTEGLQVLVNQAGATFDSERIQKLANEINAKLEDMAKRQRATKLLAALQNELDGAGLGLDAALAQLRQSVPAEDPRRRTVEAQIETKLAGQVAMAQANDDLGGAGLRAAQWLALFPQSPQAQKSKTTIDALLAQRGLKEQIAAAEKLLLDTRFGVAEVKQLASQLKAMRAHPQANNERAALDRIEQTLLSRLEREVAEVVDSNPAQAEQLLAGATGDLPKSAKLVPLQQRITSVRIAAVARDEENRLTVLLGTLAIDALPWARVLSIKDAAGKPVALPADPVTPLVITLSEGSYTLELADSGGNRRTQTALVARQQRAQIRVVFQTTKADAYLKEAGF